MLRIVLIIIAAGYAATGAVALAAPETFYHFTPGVPLTGPFNTHFLRDVGLALMVSGAALGWGAVSGAQNLMIAGAGWPTAHAVYHLLIWIDRGCAPDGVALFDFAAVIAPAAIAMGIALVSPPGPYEGSAARV
ncbi:MAG: hypothetical protein AAF909_15190 [Pseudomonadota bacterium]